MNATVNVTGIEVIARENLTGVLFTTLNGRQVTGGFLVTNLVIFMIGLCSFVFNSLVLNTLLKVHELSPHYLIICNLCVTDLLTGCLTILSAIYNIVNYQVVGECLMRLGSIIVFITCSILHVILIVAEAYVKIVHPYLYMDRIKNTTIGVVSGIIWCFSLLIGVLPALGWRNEPLESGCIFSVVLPQSYLKILIAIMLTPIIITTPFVVGLIRVANKHSRAIQTRKNAWSEEPRSKTLKSVRTVFIISMAYLLCVTPFVTELVCLVSGVFESMDDLTTRNSIVYCSAPLFFNPIINFVIYSLRLPPVRRRLRRFRRTGVDASHESTAISLIPHH